MAESRDSVSEAVHALNRSNLVSTRQSLDTGADCLPKGSQRNAWPKVQREEEVSQCLTGLRSRPLPSHVDRLIGKQLLHSPASSVDCFESQLIATPTSSRFVFLE